MDRKQMGEALDAPFDLTPQDIKNYQDSGFIRLKNVFAPEVIAHFRDAVEKLVGRLRDQKHELGLVTYAKAFTQNWNLWTESDEVKPLVFSKRLARIATAIMETSGVRLYHDQSLIKMPGGDISAMHADQFYWPLENRPTATVWIPLQATPMEMGPLAFKVGSHHLTEGRDLELLSDGGESTMQQLLRDYPLDAQPYEVGEVSFHSGWTFHRAGRNMTEYPRRVFTIIYMDSEMRLAKPTNRYQEDDLRVFMPGTEVGELVDTPLNPILYER